MRSSSSRTYAKRVSILSVGEASLKYIHIERPGHTVLSQSSPLERPSGSTQHYHGKNFFTASHPSPLERPSGSMLQHVATLELSALFFL